MAVRFGLAFLFSTAFLTAQAQLKLLIFDLSEGASIALSDPMVLDSTGLLDDIPSFHPTAPFLYYSSTENGRFSIIACNYGASERSKTVIGDRLMLVPRIMPDGKHLSFLEAETPQRHTLKKVALATGQTEIVSGDHAFESYYWMDDNTVLGVTAGDPNELMLITLRPKRAIPVAKNVGNFIQASRERYFFVHKLSVDSWSLKEINRQGNIEIRTQTLEESECFAVLPGGNILMAQENELFVYRDNAGWKKIHVPAQGFKEILSLTINPLGNKLAMLVAHH